MKRQKIKLTIDNPCQQKWTDFEDRGGRGFCSSCQKEVIDFTRMSDEEIMRYFKDLPQNVCGQLRQDQMRIYAEPAPKRRHSKLWAWPFAAMATLFSAHAVEGQTKDPIEKVVVPTEVKPIGLAFPRMISGIVKDLNGNPLSNVEIKVEHSTKIIKTDSLGYYEILVPKANSSVTYSLAQFMEHTEIIDMLTSGNVTLKTFEFTGLGGFVGGISACQVIHTNSIHEEMKMKALINLIFR
jgi:hypothetical protein